MNLRLAVLSLIAKYDLSAEAGAELKRLANLGAAPPSLPRQLPLGMAILGAALGGLGIVFWIAANWESLSRFGRFALLQATLICMLLGALRRPSARVSLSLLGFLACGGLFAYFGQTYQTGADPWQLFALWAALTLPLCLGVRHDVLWTAWATVALTAALLWSRTDAGFNSYRSTLGCWMPALALVFAFRFIPTTVTGTGLWPMRLCMIYAAIGMATTALIGLIGNERNGIYLITLVAVGVLTYVFSLRQLFDVFVISALGLSANVLFVAGFAWLLLHDSRGIETGTVLLIGCVAAGLLAGTVKLLMHLTRAHTT